MDDFFAENDIENDPDDCIIRRELTAAGKSRAFINDSPVALSQLKELGERLVDVHSQHQNLLLNKQDFQLNVVDIIANDSQPLDHYRETFSDYQEADQQLDHLREDIERNRQNVDFLQFQYEELTAAKLNANEQEELEQMSETMTHAEDIKSALYSADNALQGEERGAVESLRTAISALKNITHVFPDVEELTERLDTTYIELKDIAQEIGGQLGHVDFDPVELDRINSRLDKLYDLEKKYHAETVGQLIEQRDELGRKLNNIENSDEALADLQRKVEQLKTQCQQ